MDSRGPSIYKIPATARVRNVHKCVFMGSRGWHQYITRCRGSSMIMHYHMIDENVVRNVSSKLIIR